MSSDTPRKLVSPRQGAVRLNIPIGNIYRASKRGTIKAAEGPDVPKGLWFEEAEFLRWAGDRQRLQCQGRPRGAA